jgi:hypothetical protein
VRELLVLPSVDASHPIADFNFRASSVLANIFQNFGNYHDFFAQSNFRILS